MIRQFVRKMLFTEELVPVSDIFIENNKKYIYSDIYPDEAFVLSGSVDVEISQMVLLDVFKISLSGYKRAILRDSSKALKEIVRC